MKRICKSNGIIFLLFVGMIIISIIIGSCEGKSSTTQLENKTSSNQSDESKESSSLDLENKTSSGQPDESKEPVSSWDEGFNASWVGTYESSKSADYAVIFELSADGTYKLSYGEGAVTTYSGKYNKNFRGGVTKSPLRYTITELRIIGFDEKTITVSSDWKLPGGNDTEVYILYRQ
jgi:hypothetical protein